MLRLHSDILQEVEPSHARNSPHGGAPGSPVTANQPLRPSEQAAAAIRTNVAYNLQESHVRAREDPPALSGRVQNVKNPKRNHRLFEKLSLGSTLAELAGWSEDLWEGCSILRCGGLGWGERRSGGPAGVLVDQLPERKCEESGRWTLKMTPFLDFGATLSVFAQAPLRYSSGS